MRARAIMICLLLAGCASVVSTRHEEAGDTREGLLYFLPKQDIILTVIVAKDEASIGAPIRGTPAKPAAATAANGDGGTGTKNGEDESGKKDDKKKEEGKPATPTPSPSPGFTGKSGRYTVNVATIPPYPDRSQAYWLTFGTNWLGKNALNIGVSPTGLLQSATSTTEPGISEALTGLAKAAAYTLHMALDDSEGDPCGKGVAGTYVYRIEIPDKESNKKRCGLMVNLEVASALQTGLTAPLTKKEAHGLYYRQAIPYVVTVTGTEIVIAGILTSPSESNRYFLPAESTVFAKNSAEFGFKDGMPTLYRQEADGEIVAFLKLPADIIGAYFGAIGEMFTGLSKEPAGEAALIKAQTELEYARFRQEQCLAAIQGNDSETIAATCTSTATTGEK